MKRKSQNKPKPVETTAKKAASEALWYAFKLWSLIIVFWFGMLLVFRSIILYYRG